ncbi:MAG: tetratricopeptide repeat protein [Candidatus Latescibacteria bacterium]|nr:tetratricopeptide repeat protein [Candidatus Latescibacterota bacterium]
MTKVFQYTMAFMLFLFASGTQSVAATQNLGHWYTYDVTDGLGSGKVSDIMLDQQGYLWFATLGGGVSRYDGEDWQSFTTIDGLAHNWVHTIFQDRKDNLWFGTSNGVSKFDGKTWTTFTTKDGLASNAILSIIQDQNDDLWFGTGSIFSVGGKGVSKFDGENWTTFTTKDGLVGNTVYAITQDKQNNLWFGTNNGVSKFDGKAWTTRTTKDGLADNTVYAVTQDKQNNLWFGTNNGISKFDGKAWTTFSTKDGLANNQVRSICQDRNDNLWFGTNGGGVSQFDGEKWTTLTTADGLTHNWVVAVFQDREGHLWFGSDGGGISRYSKTFRTFTAEDGLANDVIVSAFQDREGSLWFGSDGGGVSKFNGKEWHTFTTKDGLAGNKVRSITQDSKGTFWFGTEQGVSKFDGTNWQTFTTEDGLTQNHIYAIFFDHINRLWVGTGSFDISGKGVSRFDGTRWQTFTTKDGLANNTVFSIAQDRDNNLWFGTLNGISKYDGTNVHIYTTKDGLAHNQVRCIFQDRDGNLWFGTEQGVSLFDGKNFTNYTTKNGLVDNQVRSIFQDREGNLWFGTLGGGVTRFDGKVFQNMTLQDGLAGNGIYAILQDKTGSLWFGTLGGGVTRYTPPPPVHPPIFIDAIVAGRRYENTDELSVPSSVGLIAFEFHGISFKTRSNAMIYRYRLKGHQDNWEVTHNRRVEFQDLPTGDYIFEVQAIDRDLVYSKQTDTATLKVYYQPMSSSVQIAHLNIQDVFPSYYKTYSEFSIGTIEVSNDDPNPIEAKVSFFIPDFMNRPTEQTVTLSPQSKQTIPLRAIFNPDILNLKDNVSVQAEVALSCEVSSHTIAVKKLLNTNIYGRGTLMWDDLGRAAAFVTPEDPDVTRFARGLYDTYRRQIKTSASDGNIPTAMLIFEALNAHGIKYAQDSSTPYSQVRANHSVLDNIQYPSELLQSKLGDCDDCTVLYCSLLENLNISTAFIDYPEHILMMFDSGVTARHAFGFRMQENRYILRNGRFWIPIEVTKLGEGSFMDAWDLGLKICERLQPQGALKITDVRRAWGKYPYALPEITGEWEHPDPEALERFFQTDINAFQKLRNEYVQREYILPLIQNPKDHIRRIELVQTKIEAEDFNDAIITAVPLLETEYRAHAYFLMGCAYAAQKDIRSAVTYFEKALENDPENPDYANSLSILKKILAQETQ